MRSTFLIFYFCIVQLSIVLLFLLSCDKGVYCTAMEWCVCYSKTPALQSSEAQSRRIHLLVQFSNSSLAAPFGF